MLGQYFFRQTELASDAPHLILEQLSQWLDQCKREILRKASHIMMRLDGLRGASNRDRLDHVRVKSSLHQVSCPVRTAGHLARLLIEHSDKLRTDPFSFIFRICYTTQTQQKAFDCVHPRDLESH